MKVLIIGAHGKVGRLLVDELKARKIDFAAGLRKEEQIKAYQTDGISTQYIDLTASPKDIQNSIAESGADTIVFSAGAGGAGYDKTIEIDLDGAIKTMDAAQILGIKRYVMVSAVYSDDRTKWEASGIRPYYVAKHYADKYLRSTNLDYTIVHPGTLTDDPATGKVNIQSNYEGGSVARADVAKVIAQAIQTPSSIKNEYNFSAGDQDIQDVIR
ncbi:SDR family oxidoreductase [Companilactobacillus pabuli]|uniref:SDR family oxidoreductase n=1 Tax=Companilactobacillus pabuli TaxID=2714036 RepID=A0A7L7KZQ4_9LACO|nr:SDR family oxidoreductase [Companilactobacillus pabuli]AKP02612.1 epimerase [Companilactobacillus farciminis]AKS50909.1 epimerase [Companilactobacillus farciminis]MDG5114046.1 SDR family oxidoreductase [Companilactobacillus pabuli]QMT84796.1 SDR family oxidoreductase [Companilactobacillus pabuli]GAQ02527.1 epimerase [Companilactobacillus farciminis]